MIQMIGAWLASLSRRVMSRDRWLAPPAEMGHASVSDEVLAFVSSLSPQEARRFAIEAGIIDKDDNLIDQTGDV